MAKQFVHVLVTATYGPTDMPIPSRMISAAVGDVLRRTENVHRLMAYSMDYPMTPMQCGLRDAWNKMEEEHEAFAALFPDLATAISLMCGGDDEGESGTSSGDEAKQN